MVRLKGFTLAEIVEATGGVLVQGSSSSRVRGVSTDTRSIGRGELFVAVRGGNFDGHDFLAGAAKSGATALLVDRKDVALPNNVAAVRVDDTVRAYGLIARYHRRRFSIPVIAVTGSAGKTTTKELVASVLRRKYRVLYNKGTDNNHIGVPATLLRLRAGHTAAVIETGTNHPGEIDWLASIVEPTVAVFTNVGPSHLAGLGTPEGVFHEKAALAKHVAAGGTLIVNTDDALLAGLLRDPAEHKVVSYGVEKPADLQAGKVEADARRISFVADGTRFEIKTPSRSNVYNALAAIACGRLLGVPTEDVRRGLLAFRTPPGRQVVHRLVGLTLIDDTYNANPLSFRNALQTLGNMRGKGRSVVVCADMLELGDSAERLHRDVGAFAAAQGVDVLLTCGRLAHFIALEARAQRPETDVRQPADQAAALEELKGILRPGDVVLVKGSRGMRMEKVVQGLTEYLKG